MRSNIFGIEKTFYICSGVKTLFLSYQKDFMKNPLKTSKEKWKCCPTEEALYANTLEKHLEKYATITKPHQHDLYWMLYLTEGSGTHQVDGKEYALQPGSF